MPTVNEMRALMLQTRRPRLFDLPASGQISASDINVELGRAYNAPFDINGTEERALAEVPTGEISFSDFHGKSSYTNTLYNQVNNLSTGYLDGSFGSMTPDTVDVGSGETFIQFFYTDGGYFRCKLFDQTPLSLDITMPDGITTNVPRVQSDYNIPIPNAISDYLVANSETTFNIKIKDGG